MSTSPAELRVALVTGSSRGIGRMVAHRLAEAGYAVALHGRSEGSASATAAELVDKYGAEVLELHGDVADPADVKAMARRIFEWHKRLDALVVNAGTHEAGLLG